MKFKIINNQMSLLQFVNKIYIKNVIKLNFSYNMINFGQG